MKDFFKAFRGHFLPSDDNAYRPHLLRKPWLLFFLTVVLTSEGLYIAALATEQSTQNFLSAVLPGEVIALTNVERTNVGDGALVENNLLDAAAQHKADDMAAKGYFSHVGPDGKEPWAWIAEAGYTYRFAGENLAVRFDNSSDVVNAWMASPTHKANIVKSVYKEIGIGVAQGIYEGSPATFVVQYFGTEQPQADESSQVSEQLPATSPSAAVAGASVEENQLPHASVSSSTPPAATPEQEQQAAASTLDKQNFSMREAAQTFLRGSEVSQDAARWTIGGIAAFLVLLLGLAFFVHLEIQPGQMLAGGAVIAAIAITLFSLNNSIYSAQESSQAAAAAQAFAPTVLVGEDAAYSEMPLGNNY